MDVCNLKSYIKRSTSILCRFYYYLISILYSLFKRVKIHGDIRNIHIGANCSFESGVLFVVQKGTIVIGNNCIFKRGCIINTYGGDIHIGNNCSFNPYCIIDGDGGLVIGDDVRIAAHTVIVSANHIFTNKSILIRDQGETKRGICIGQDVWIGAGVKILDGVEVGSGAVIGAGSVITKNIEPYSINVGTPSRILGYRK